MLAVRRRAIGVGTAISRDEVEQRIIGAYVQLACAPDRHGPSTALVARIGASELRLSEVPEEQRLPGAPSFWLELYSRAQHSVLDRCGCSEFDERELSRLLQFVVEAEQRTSP